MEQRRRKRYKNDNKCTAMLLPAISAIIENISVDGICVETPEYLTPGNRCIIEIAFGNEEKIMPTCVVAWSTPIKILNANKNTLSINAGGLKFIDLNDAEKQFLEKNISQLVA